MSGPIEIFGLLLAIAHGLRVTDELYSVGSKHVACAAVPAAFPVALHVAGESTATPQLKIYFRVFSVSPI